jgi:salicylate hydroxylase
MDTLPKDALSRVKFGKSLTAINGASDDNGITVAFDDGTSEGPFDLVVGCDGVNSAVKEYVETGAISPGNQGRSQALYSGIRIRYAVQDENTSDETEDTKDNGNARLTQYFGNGAYALSGKYGSGKGRPPIKCAFTIYLDDDYIGPFRKSEKEETIQKTSTEEDENSDWSQDNRKGTSERMLEQVEAYSIPDIEIRPIIENASRFFELGVYLHNPLSWKGWSKEVPGSSGRYCVTGGDAAHAMPPFLGQGSNQAIQDAYCLAKNLFDYNKHLQSGGVDAKEVVDIAKVLKSYEKTRWAPTTSISAKASVLGYLEASTGFIAKFRDVFFFTLGSLGVAKRVYLGAAVPEVGDVAKKLAVRTKP